MQIPPISGPSISIVVPCYNGRAYLEKTLEKIGRQTSTPEEILFIDDGSTDGSAALAERFPVRILANGQNRGLACTRNRAIAEARGDIILFLDIDAWPDERLVEILRREFADPAVAAAGGQGIEVNVQNLADAFRRKFFSQGLGPRRRDPAHVLFGLCSAYRKTVLAELGGFDPMFRTNGEDFDLSFRLRREGRRIVYNPELKVYHHRQDTEASFRQLVYRWFYWGGRAFRKNGRIFFLPFLLKIVADLPRHLLFAVFEQKSVHAARIAFAIARLRLRATWDVRLGRTPDLECAPPRCAFESRGGDGEKQKD